MPKRSSVLADCGAGVRLRRAQLHSRLVHFPSELKITDARTAPSSAASDDATSFSWAVADLSEACHTSVSQGLSKLQAVCFDLAVL